MKFFRLAKGNGQYRNLVKLTNQEAQKFRDAIPLLNDIYYQNEKYLSAYAFINGRNCVLKAMQHIGRNYVYSVDIKNFFDNIKPQHVKKYIDSHLINLVFIKGNLYQGLPTSPIVSNIAMIDIDHFFNVAFQRFNIDVTYTRYADDLCFSFDNKKHLPIIRNIIKQKLNLEGFDLNNKKTKLQTSKNGRIIITGVAIDHSGIYPTRKTIKKIRAAIHQENYHSANGLLEWSFCRLPKRQLML